MKLKLKVLSLKTPLYLISLLLSLIVLPALIFTTPQAQVSAAPAVPTAVAPNTGSADGGYRYSLSGNGFLTETTGTTNVSMGVSHACSITSGSAYCWGANSYGQLGDGTTTLRSAPTKVGGLLADKTVTKISTGWEYSCAVANGEVYCWGRNTWNQLGNGSGANSSTPIKVLGEITGNTAIDVSVGFAHTCAITSNNNAAYCWGFNDFGRLGDGTTTHRPTSVKLNGPLLGKSVTSISVGYYHGCAVADNEAYCWGSNGNGQLGDGTTTQRVSPTKVGGIIAGKNVTMISTDTNHACVIADQKPYCWGLGSNGQLGNTSTISSSVPVQSSVSLSTNFSYITTGATHSCAIGDSQAYCWGNNANGQLGDGTITQRTSPTRVAGQVFSNYPNMIDSSENSSCTVVNGVPYCWGGRRLISTWRWQYW